MSERKGSTPKGTFMVAFLRVGWGVEVARQTAVLLWGPCWDEEVGLVEVRLESGLVGQHGIVGGTRVWG